MDQIPVIVYVMPVIGIVLFFVMRGRMKSTLARGEEQNAASRAGEIAKRIGLTVVEGDANLNLLYAHSFILAGTLKEARVRLEGSPSGRRGEVVYYERQEIKTGFGSTTVTTFFDGRVSVEVRAPFPEFEVVLRKPPSWVGTPKMQISAAAHPFGHPTLDPHGRRVVVSNDMDGIETIASYANVPAEAGPPAASPWGPPS